MDDNINDTFTIPDLTEKELNIIVIALSQYANWCATHHTPESLEFTNDLKSEELIALELIKRLEF